MNNIPKVPPPDAFSGEQGKLRSFLAKLNSYIGFNQKQFSSETDKGLYTVAYLKDAAFDWVDPKLHEFLDKTPYEQTQDEDSIFNDFKRFKEELRRAFGVVDKKRAPERRLHTLRMNKSAAKYAAEFQRIAALTDWDDDALVSHYYWGLSETIKDEIARRDRTEELQEMIDTSINIDNRQWERRMEKMEPRVIPRMWGRRFTTRVRGDPMDLDNIEKRGQKPGVRSAEHRRHGDRPTKPHNR